MHEPVTYRVKIADESPPKLRVDKDGYIILSEGDIERIAKRVEVTIRDSESSKSS